MSSGSHTLPRSDSGLSRRHSIDGYLERKTSVDSVVTGPDTSAVRESHATPMPGRLRRSPAVWDLRLQADSSSGEASPEPEARPEITSVAGVQLDYPIRLVMREEDLYENRAFSHFRTHLREE